MNERRRFSEFASKRQLDFKETEKAAFGTHLHGAFNKYPVFFFFFVQAFKIGVDSWEFSR